MVHVKFAGNLAEVGRRPEALAAAAEAVALNRELVVERNRDGYLRGWQYPW